MYIIPFIFYNSATIIMYNLSYTKYTGWSRLQSIFCIPLLFIKLYDINKIASDLIWLNSFGCAISIHFFYILTNYEILNIMASRNLIKFKFYKKIHNKFIIHLIADALLHWSPCLLCLIYIKHEYHNHKKYIWLLPAITHTSYSYLLIRSWNPCSLYELDDIYPIWKYRTAWILTFIGYYIISYTI
jgi:hypothetical protein